MSKGKSFISEIGKYFKENDATSAMNRIMDITRMLNLSEKRLFGEGKQMQLQILAAAGATAIVVVSLFHDQECV